MKILAIESSCDETACAVVEDGRKVLSNVIYTQIAIHKEYGGVVPEIAARKHIEKIGWVVETAINEASINKTDIDAIAVTNAPGLIGALLTGVGYAKGLAYSLNLPLIPVHHIRGHIAANYITHTDLQPPFLALVVSGGHSNIVKVNSFTEYEIIGRTRDDAAGEAFDKVSRVLGLGYPGGVEIEKKAIGNKEAIKLPITEFEDAPYDFSFSGLKTKVINLINTAKQKGEDIPIEDFAASFNYTVAKTLSDKFMKAAKDFNIRKLVVAGGVSANKMLREMLSENAKREGFTLYMPDMKYCGDNAAMIGSQAYYEYLENNIANLYLNAYATKNIAEK